MKKELTFDNYIAMCDRFDKAEVKCGDWWPTVTEIQTKIEPKIEPFLDFLIWIAETADEPKTEAQRESKRYINRLLNETLVFIEKSSKKTDPSENSDDASFSETDV